MIIEKLKDESQLTESERLIAHFLLDENNQIENLTSIEVGKRSYASQSAVVRLYKKLGISTYREFISKLVIEKREALKAENLVDDNPSQYFSSYDSTMNTIIKLYEKTLTNTNLLMNQNVVLRVCNRLMNATSIDIYGVGISYTIAKSMAFKLQALGMHASDHNGTNHYYLENMKDIKRNVSILISLTGSNETILNIAQKLKDKNAYTVGIMGRKDEKLNEYCQDCLLFDTHIYDDVDVMCSTMAAGYIVDLIYGILISRD